MKRTLTNLLLAVLVGSFMAVSCVSDLKSDIDNIEDKWEAAEADLQTQITTLQKALQGYKDEVTPKLAALDAQLKANFTTLSEADANLNKALKEAQTALQAQIDKNASDNSATNDALKAAIAEYKKLVADAIADFETAMAKIKEDQAAVDKTQDLLLQALATQVETYKKAIDENLQELGGYIDTLDGSIDTLDEKVDKNLKAAKDYTDALQIAVKATTDALEKRIKANEDAIKKINEETIPAINKALASLKDEKLDKTVYNAFVTEFNTWKGTVNGEITNVKALIETLDAQIDELELEIAAITGDEGAIATIKQQIKDAVAAAKKELQDQIDAITGDIATINGDEETEGSIAYAVKVLENKLQTAIDTLAGRVTASEEEIAKLKARVQSLVFVPRYTDGKFGVPFSEVHAGEMMEYVAYNKPEEGFTVVYKVAPADSAEALAQQAANVFHFVVESDLKARTKAIETNPELTILKAVGNKETGKITFHLAHKDFVGLKVKNSGYAVSLRVDDDDKGIHVASEYILSTLQPSPQIDVDMTRVYKVDATTGKIITSTEVTDREIVLLGDNVPTDRTAEVKKSIPYTDGTPFAPYKNYELGTTIEDVEGKYTYAELVELGYDMPDTPVNVASKTAVCDYLILKVPEDQPATETTEAVKAKGTDATVKVDTTCTATVPNMMKIVKKHIDVDPVWGDALDPEKDHLMGVNFAFTTGLGNAVNMQTLVNIAKTDKQLEFVLTHKMNWTYKLDAKVDHDNFTHDTWQTNYTRKDFEVVPKLIVTTDAKKDTLTLDGSNKVYGLEVKDFDKLAFTRNTAKTLPEKLIYNEAENDFKATWNSTKSILTLANVGVAERLGNEYPVEGTYPIEYAAAPAEAKVLIDTKDRYKDAIALKLTDFPVTLLGGESVETGGQYVEKAASSHYYAIRSEDLAVTLLNAYQEKGILTWNGLGKDYPKKDNAFSTEVSEFNSVNISPALNPEDTKRDVNFKTTVNNDDAKFFLESDGEKLTPATLKLVAKNYGSKEVAWTYSFTSYIGQKVTLTWPITAVPKKDYKFNTYSALVGEKGEYYYNVPSTVWQGTSTAITGAKTELDLIKHNNIGIITGVDGAGAINQDEYETLGLVPEFRLARESDGISVKDNTVVHYYGKAEQVTIKSALYILSDAEFFLLPNSDKMYINSGSNAVDTICIHKFVPIAPAADQTTEAQVVIGAGKTGTLPFDLKDRNGNLIYKNGAAQSNKGNYAETIKHIFGDIKLSLVSVDGEETIPAGWALSEAATPDLAQLTVPAGDPAVHTIKVKVDTVWEEYEYTFKVWTGPAESAVNAFNSDYGKGGNKTWN